MSSPISSVPDPSETGSTSADPLAGVITQVSQTAPRKMVATNRGGPARPTKVAKQGTAKAASLEKKKKKPAPGAEDEIGAATAKPIDAAGGASKPPTEGVVAVASGEDESSASHSQVPSSTLIGTTNTQPSILTTHESAEGLSKDKPVDASATPTEPDPTVADTKPTSGTSNQQDMTEAAQKLSKGPPSPKATAKDVSNKEAIEMSEKGTAESAPSPTALSNNKPAKRPGLMAKIIAILTCSSASGAMVESERASEKSPAAAGQAKQSANGRATKSEVKKGTTRTRVVPSRRTSMERTASTPGGGTRLPKEETGDVMSGAVVPPGSTFVTQEGDKRGAAALGAGAVGGAALGGVAAHKLDDEDTDGQEDDEGWMGDEDMQEDEDQTEEQRLIMQGGAGIPKDENGNPQPLLGAIGSIDTGRKCLVLDLDETLVHSSFKMISNADFTVPVEIEGTVHNVYVIKRPGVDEFMRQMGEIYEVVVFTASLAKYADPVLDKLDIHEVVRHRLFRESCYNHKGNYVKDLSQLGRDIHTSIIIDNSPASYIFHPNNAVPISSWFNDPHDTELTDLCPFLAEMAEVDDVRAVLDGGL